ncbi:MAG: hypothetical protein KC800_11125 [Candidatus Eremiobacteraeota bacterium]|nr:hypothetical protein [Candidatus Eremiobacteraeota bacterium]
MRILISRLHRENDQWALNPDRPVALLDISGSQPQWTFYDGSYRDKLLKNFEEPVYFDQMGVLRKPEPYTMEALRYLFEEHLPNLGLGACQFEEQVQ